MENKLKTFFSILIIGIFILFGFASIEPDGSTNTTVEMDTSRCMTMPLIITPLSFSVIHRDRKTGLPIPFAKGEFFYTIQVVTMPPGPEGCKYDIKADHKSFTTDSLGRFSETFPSVTQANAADLIRGEIKMDETATYGPGYDLLVNYYGSTDFYFQTLSLKKSDLYN